MAIGRPLALGAAALGAAQALPALAPLLPALSSPLGITWRLGIDDGVALTFDDGPHPQGTPRVLEELRRAGATATFFLAGEQVARRPHLAVEIVAAGHGVELHCHRHRNNLRLTRRAFLEDAERGRSTIEDATGRPIGDYRPPYGIFSATTLRAARRRGWRPLLWSRWGKDWRRDTSPGAIAALATAGIRGGDVVLLHDADFYSAPGSWARTAAALPIILEELETRGLKTVSLRR